MNTKLKQEGNHFLITKKKPFYQLKFNEEDINNAFEFAFDMTFGNKGEHRGYRSGGQYSRKNGELFANTFQGKLAEFAFFAFLMKNGISSNEPDLSKWELGKWDDTDFIINGKKISIKSAAFFSNLLLLETKDWKNDGTYIPNQTIYDFHVLIRISPDIKSILRTNKLFYSNEADKNSLKKIVTEKVISYDLPGFLSNKELVSIISERQILPQNSLLNGKVKMDAENFYCQTGDLIDLDQIIEKIK
jgi:hypothetical protein